MQDEQREITNQIKHMEADIRDYDVKIDAEWKRLSAAAGEDQEPIQRKIKELEIETSDHSLAITQMEHKVEQIAEVIDQGREEFLSRQRDVRGIEAEVSDLQQSLQKLRGSKNNELYAFDGAASVRREIDAFRPWKSKPLGPIGSFVKIKPEFQRFAEVIDSFFGLHLNAFVVNNPQDREEMMRIFKKVGMQSVSFLPSSIDVQTAADPTSIFAATVSSFRSDTIQTSTILEENPIRNI